MVFVERAAHAGPHVPVADVMAWPVAVLPAEASLLEVAESLAADEVGALLVLESARLAGVVSERDVVSHLATGADPEHLTAGEVMATDLVVVSPGETVREAASRMRDAGVRHLPVLDGESVVGVVSLRDVVRVLLDGIDADAEVVVRSGARVVVRAE